MDTKAFTGVLAAALLAAGGVVVAGRTLSRPAYGEVLSVRPRVEDDVAAWGPSRDHDVEQRVTGYEVTYLVDGDRRTVVLDRDPGRKVRLAEVDAIAARARRAADVSAL